MTRERVIIWSGSTDEVFVLLPPDLASFFGLPEGFHFFLEEVIVETESTGIIMLVNDPMGVLAGLDSSLGFDVVENRVLSRYDNGVIRPAGMDVVRAKATTAGVGFQETSQRRAGWDIQKGLAFARNDVNDEWTITLQGEVVPGPMSWDPLSETSRIRQIRPETTPGGVWFQTGSVAGDPYFKVELGGSSQ